MRDKGYDVQTANRSSHKDIIRQAPPRGRPHPPGYFQNTFIYWFLTHSAHVLHRFPACKYCCHWIMRQHILPSLLDVILRIPLVDRPCDVVISEFPIGHCYLETYIAGRADGVDMAQLLCHHYYCHTIFDAIGKISSIQYYYRTSGDSRYYYIPIPEITARYVVNVWVGFNYLNAILEWIRWRCSKTNSELSAQPWSCCANGRQWINDCAALQLQLLHYNDDICR